jgi:hypothetical protein
MVLSSLGGDAVGAILPTSTAPSRHHRDSLTAVVNWTVEF